MTDTHIPGSTKTPQLCKKEKRREKSKDPLLHFRERESEERQKGVEMRKESRRKQGFQVQTVKKSRDRKGQKEMSNQNHCASVFFFFPLSRASKRI